MWSTVNVCPRRARGAVTTLTSVRVSDDYLFLTVSAALQSNHGARDVFPAPQHNHATCLDDAIRSAREAFKRHEMPFTPLREKVFREIAGSYKAVGTYDVLNSLATKRHATNACLSLSNRSARYSGISRHIG